MRTWFEQGHLKDSLPVRFGRHGLFQAIEDQSFPAMNAFQGIKDAKDALRALRDELRDAMRR